jgi:hypothetical protein
VLTSLVFCGLAALWRDAKLMTPISKQGSPRPKRNRLSPENISAIRFVQATTPTTPTMMTISREAIDRKSRPRLNANVYGPVSVQTRPSEFRKRERMALRRSEALTCATAVN